jgi:ABC-type spermidine/putrescine transport system permease subunit I
MHKIRFAQDLALYNMTLTEEIEGFDGAAHLDAWNNDPAWQGVRKVTEKLTAVDNDWGESIFATNVVFEPLLGELFRSNLVMQAAAQNGDYITPTVIGAAELMYQAGQVESATFRSFESFAFASAAYLTVSLVITGLATWYHHRFPVRTI